MRNIALLFITVFLLLSLPVFAAKKQNQALHEWLKYYYLHRDNRHVVTAMNYFFSEQDQTSEIRKMSLLGSFATLFQQNPEKALDWVKDTRLTKKQRGSLITCLWYAGMIRAAVELAGDDNWPQARIDAISKPAPDFLSMPVRQPAEIGLLWGAYRISGDKQYVLRIIRIILDSAEDPGGRYNILVTSTAAQSLNIYIAHHDQVAQQYSEIRKKLSSDDRLNLDLLLSEHESMEEEVDCD